jgi:hypothetical protein
MAGTGETQALALELDPSWIQRARLRPGLLVLGNRSKTRKKEGRTRLFIKPISARARAKNCDLIAFCHNDT